jgi:hypothetical protein
MVFLGFSSVIDGREAREMRLFFGFTILTKR